MSADASQRRSWIYMAAGVCGSYTFFRYLVSWVDISHEMFLLEHKYFSLNFIKLVIIFEPLEILYSS